MMFVFIIFFFKQKTAYEMRISDWSSDVCSSDLLTVLISQRTAVRISHPPQKQVICPKLRSCRGTDRPISPNTALKLGEPEHIVRVYIEQNFTPQVYWKIGRAHV